jgi:hypothetical protein
MRRLYILLISVILLLLTGCVNGVFHVKVNKDGSGDLDYRLAIDSNLLSNGDQTENPLQEFKKLAQQDGFIVSQFKDKGYFGVEAKKHVENISDTLGSELIKYLSPTNNEKVDFTIDKGLLFNVYRLNTNLDLKDMIHEDDPFTSMILDKMDLKMLITLPTDANNHNASRIELGSVEKSKTYEWDLLPGQDNEIYLEAKVLNTTNVILLVLISIAAVLVTVYALRKRVKIQQI